MSKWEQHFYEFGEHRLIPAERLLLRNGEPVALTPKAFEMLVLLVQRSGKLVDKSTLLEELWPGTAVEESNIAQNIFALRRALGVPGDEREYIETVPKRGYRFLPEVRIVSPEPAAAPVSATLPSATEPLPVALPVLSAAASRRTRWVAALAIAIVLMAVLVILARRSGTGQAADTAPEAATVSRLLSGSRIASACISPDGRYVAHVVSYPDRTSILVRQVSTTTDLEIVPGVPGAYYWGLAYSRDGDSLYFVRSMPNDPVTTLYRVSALGGTPRKILSGIDSQIGLSPDGKMIAFIRDTQSERSTLVVANAEGDQERVVATRSRPESTFSSSPRGGPAWSPDGSTIATGVISLEGGYHGEVVAVRVSDGTQTPLTTRRFHQVAQVAWLPDGQSLLITARESGFAQIWRIEYPSGVTRRLTTDVNDYRGITLTADARTIASVQYDRRARLGFVPPLPSARNRNTEGMDEGFYGLAWIPGGGLVYASQASGNVDLWVLEADGTTRQLTTDPEHDSTPAVSPDGRTVAFISTRIHHTPHVWRVDLDGGNARQLTHQRFEGTPSFTPDGKWVVYAVAGEGLWKVPAHGGQPVQIASGDLHTPSISPDGQWIAGFYRAPLRDAVGELAIVPMQPGSPMRTFPYPDGFSSATVRWTPDGNALIYVSTHDEVSNLRTIPLDGSEPRNLTEFEADQIFNFAWTQDRRQLALSRGTTAEHVVLIRDFR
jgi:Tol biopolymer transport system component/DNA-binding winged helix-turn-helix (wHTH) protein